VVPGLERARIFKTPVVEDHAAEAAAFSRAYDEVCRQAYLLARQLGRGPDDAAEVVQEAAFRGWRYRKGRVGEFRPWFLAIVFRLATHPRRPWLTVPYAWRPGQGPGLVSEVDPEIMEALRRLPVRQRSALWLRYCEDMSTADVALVMRATEPAIKQLLLRARESLRRELKDVTP
jgi:RNA polymerase sigma-70 factor (ECF subfamily)